jgi:hypothetical protein
MGEDQCRSWSSRAWMRRGRGRGAGDTFYGSLWRELDSEVIVRHETKSKDDNILRKMEGVVGWLGWVVSLVGR